MQVQFLVLFNGEKFVAVMWSNRVEKLSEVADVSSLMRLEVSSYENDALVGKSVAFLALLPEADVEIDALLVNLEKSGLSWCYVIETAPQKSPCIYMFIGKGLTKEYVIDELEEGLANIPENIHLYFEDKPFSSIDIDDYDNSISEFEKELIRKASDVFKVYEP